MLGERADRAQGNMGKMGLSSLGRRMSPPVALQMAIGAVVFALTCAPNERNFAMVKAMIQLYPVLPAAGEAERRALRPLGRNRDRYQQTLEGWHDIIKAADDLRRLGRRDYRAPFPF